MNVNSEKLADLIASGDKRLKKLQEDIPRTTIAGNARGQVPSLRHAAVYKKVLRLRFEDWLVQVKDFR